MQAPELCQISYVLAFVLNLLVAVTFKRALDRCSESTTKCVNIFCIIIITFWQTIEDNCEYIIIKSLTSVVFMLARVRRFTHYSLSPFYPIIHFFSPNTFMSSVFSSCHLSFTSPTKSIQPLTRFNRKSVIIYRQLD